MTLARRQLNLALDQQAAAQVQVDMAVEDLQAARRTGDERKIREAKEEVKEAKEEVKEAKEEVKEAKESERGGAEGGKGGAEGGKGGGEGEGGEEGGRPGEGFCAASVSHFFTVLQCKNK